MKIVAPRLKADTAELDFHPVDSYSQFELLASFLVEWFDAKIVNKLDGPDARCWGVLLDNIKFELSHRDDIGNALVGPPGSLGTLTHVASRLNDLLNSP